MYVIGGEVSISMPQSSSFEETIQNTYKIASVAAAAGYPFSQDFSVALSPRVMEMQSKGQRSSSKTRMRRDLYK